MPSSIAPTRLSKALPGLGRCGAAMADDLKPASGLTIISRCGGGLRLVSDRPKGWEWESFPRLAVRPRYQPSRKAAVGT